MTSGDPTPRLLAAAASLTGTGILMCRADPSLDGILTGLLCLGLWALGTVAARLSRLRGPVRPARPQVLEAIILETPRHALELLPAPRPSSRAVERADASLLPAVPTYRQRVVERYTRRRR